jgi:Radical SAM superfamily/4Fe-4S single cluster domain
MMKFTSLHLMLTYQCTLECDHCFVWGSPHQDGKMTQETIAAILEQAVEVGTVRSIYFEGGEPFLCYPVLVAGVRQASRLGFKTGIVSNGYWASSVEVALQKLRPLAGSLGSLTISSDLYHWDEKFKDNYQNALRAAQELGIATHVIEIEASEAGDEDAPVGQLPPGASGVMYRGRAAQKLAGGSALHPWEQFTRCPYENLQDPGRVHIDPPGYIHICQGISMGNIFESTLKEISAAYDPDQHPVAGPLLRGGPAELCRAYGLPHAACYADACHLCYRSRVLLREQLPDVLAPDQAYGFFSSPRRESTGRRTSEAASHQENRQQPSVFPAITIYAGEYDE